jgi:siroheme synthase-like protein
MLPLALDLTGRDVVVLGAGRIGTRKAAQLVEAGAKVRVIATELLAPLPEGVTSFEQRPWSPEDLEGSWLVVSAVADGRVNDAVVAEANRRGIWLNVVDDPERSSFYFAALHRAGDVVLAVSTEGAAPALSSVLRDRLAEALPASTASTAATLRLERDAMHAAGLSTEDVDWRQRIDELLDGQEP